MLRFILVSFCIALAINQGNALNVQNIVGTVIGTAMGLVKGSKTTVTQEGITMDVNLERCSVTFGRKRFLGSLGNIFENIGNTIKNTAENVGNTIKNTAENVWDKVKPGMECTCEICVRPGQIWPAQPQICVEGTDSSQSGAAEKAGNKLGDAINAEVAKLG